MKTLRIVCLSLLACVHVLAAPGHIVLFNGTSSAGKSSLAEAMVAGSRIKYEVVSFDDFLRSYRLKREHPEGFLTSLYRHAKEQSEAGKNIIIDTVEFDRDYDKYCGILDCSNVVKAVVYCPLQDILKRIDRRNSSADPSNHRGVLICFQQFPEMYKLQSSPSELVVDRTSTGVIRAALVEAGRKANNENLYRTLYWQYVKAFGIDKDREIVLVPKGKYDLVLNTRAKTKKENVQSVEDYVGSKR